MATTLLPFRDYDEHDVINLFAYNGEVTKGHIVSINSGWKNTDEMALLGDVGNDFGNTVSERYGVKASLKLASGTSSKAIGILLHDVKETDENGEKLVFNPRKAAEMGVTLSGQAAPVATRGVFLYSGTNLTGQTVTPGMTLYHDGNGEIVTGTSAGVAIGKALGAVDSNGHCLVRIDL